MAFVAVRRQRERRTSQKQKQQQHLKPAISVSSVRSTDRVSRPAIKSLMPPAMSLEAPRFDRKKTLYAVGGMCFVSGLIFLIPAVITMQEAYFIAFVLLMIAGLICVIVGIVRGHKCTGGGVVHVEVRKASSSTSTEVAVVVEPVESNKQADISTVEEIDETGIQSSNEPQPAADNLPTITA